MGRFYSVDPLTRDYPWYTPYQFAGNTPIWAKDLEGLEPAIPGRNYILAQLGINSNDGGNLKQWTRDVPIQAAINTGEVALVIVLAEVLGYVAGGIIGGGAAVMEEAAFARTAASDATRVARPVYEPIEAAEAAGSTRVTTPNAKQIGPAGDADASVTRQVPSNWNKATSKNGQGTKFVDPNNPNGNNVRVQGGNPYSPNPAQQKPYVKETRNGKTVDVNGKQVDSKSAESHVPKEKYKYDKKK
jgi:hypothetical protein